MPNLHELRLAMNSLTGTIPSGLGLLPLSNFSFYWKASSGSVEESFYRGSMWQYLRQTVMKWNVPASSHVVATTTRSIAP